MNCKDHIKRKIFDDCLPAELGSRQPRRVPVAIIGAGPIGLAAAVDLALQGIPSIILEKTNQIADGSRAICWAKRTLEIFDRLGVAKPMLEKGVTWQVGRVFNGHDEVYNFDLLPETGYKMPAFINLQQYYVEHYLIQRCQDFPDLIEIRGKHTLIDVQQREQHVILGIECSGGFYQLEAEYCLACDGAHSTVRRLLSLEMHGQDFEERFLIADIEMEADFPAERWFWFHPPFHSGQTALLHKQPDNIYRLDLQLGWDADPEKEKQPEIVIPRIEKALNGKPFNLDWVSVYRFRCARLDRFVHNRVIFVGDSAHVVSPFGARGGNGGIHDVDNLCWKLAAVLNGNADYRLLESYHQERVHGADENILHSSRATNFMSPPNATAQLFRDQLLVLSKTRPFARKLINSGRLSMPCGLHNMDLQTASHAKRADLVGHVCPDAPLPDGSWLLSKLDGKFLLLCIGQTPPKNSLPCVHILLDEKVKTRLGAGIFLIRPDQHIAAVWDQASEEEIAYAYHRAKAMEQT